MPRRNRATPLGQLISDPARGLVYANRGCLHDEHEQIRRRYNGRRWIACRLQFKGRRRARLMAPGRYTELFFLDDATALAAGHRPCAECRREDYRSFTSSWSDVHPDQRGADEIDLQLHHERVDPLTRAQRRHELPLDDLPDGAFVLVQQSPWLVLGGELLRWTPAGYTDRTRRPRGAVVLVLTPPSLLRVLRAGWRPRLVPFLHPSAGVPSGGPQQLSRERVLGHYGIEPRWDRVEAALGRAGLDGAGVPWSAFAPLDQFHIRGLAATRELARALGPVAGQTVLDVGSGLGGPARALAGEYRCDVTGVDLNPEYVEVATRLTARSGLSSTVRFTVGNALDLPFPDAAFDHVLTQHVAMNIADRGRLYAELARVVKPGGRLAIHDVVAGDGEPPVFPVPWADTPDMSFLLTAGQTRAAITAAGFEELWFRDQTTVTMGWFEAIAGAESPAGGSPPAIGRPAGEMPPAIGLPVVMGPGFPSMLGNLADNVRHGRVGVIMLVAGRAQAGRRPQS